MSPFCRSPSPQVGDVFYGSLLRQNCKKIFLNGLSFFCFDLCRNKNSCFFQYPKGRKKVTIYFFAVIFPMRIDLFLPIQFLGLLMIIHIEHLIFVKNHGFFNLIFQIYWYSIIMGEDNPLANQLIHNI